MYIRLTTDRVTYDNSSERRTVNDILESSKGQFIVISPESITIINVILWVLKVSQVQKVLKS